MPTIDIFILTEEQNAAAMALNNGGYRLEGRQIDNPTANTLGYGDIVGMYEIPARIMNMQEYSRWWDMFSAFTVYPQVASENLFLPPPDDE